MCASSFLGFFSVVRDHMGSLLFSEAYHDPVTCGLGDVGIEKNYKLRMTIRNRQCVNQV